MFDKAISQFWAALPAIDPPLVVVNVNTSHSPPPDAGTDATFNDRWPLSTVVVPSVSVSVSELVSGALVRLRLKELPRSRKEAFAGCPRANTEMPTAIPIAEAKLTVILRLSCLPGHNFSIRREHGNYYANFRSICFSTRLYLYVSLKCKILRQM